VEPRGVGRADPFPLDPLAHATDLANAFDGEVVGVGEVARERAEATPEPLVPRHEPRPKQRLELPGLRVTLPVLEVARERLRDRAAPPLGPQAGVRLPPGVPDPIENAFAQLGGAAELGRALPLVDEDDVEVGGEVQLLRPELP